MPIIGMTDRGASFPRIGELRKGAAKPATGNAPGRDLEYFRFTSMNADVVAQFGSVYGNTPEEVQCFLPYATTDENFEAWIEEWGAGSLKWRGNGQTLVIWQKPDGTYSQEPKPQPAKGGKQVGRLKVILPALGRLAYVVALTTSVNDIVELHSNLTAYEALRGDLRGIPFILSRVPRMISTPGKDGRVRREKWLLHIEAAPEWVQAQLSAMERQALPGGDTMLLSSGDVAPDEDDIIEGEQLAPVNRQPEPAAARPVFVGVNPETGEVMTPAALDNAKWELFRKRVQDNPRPTVGSVASAAAATGAYRADNHALKAAQLLHPDVEKSTQLTTVEALKLFDDLIERKQLDQTPLFPDDKATAYAE